MIYLDGCYLAKFYLAEPDSPAVIRRITAEGAAGSSCHAIVEVNAVFHRKLREGVLTAQKYQMLRRQFDLDCQQCLWTWFPLNSGVIAECQRVFQDMPGTQYLRTGDALHLACAKVEGFTEIHSSDRHLLLAAPLFALVGVKL